MDGRLLKGDDAAGLRVEAARAVDVGADAVLVGPGTLCDPVVLASGLAPAVPDLILGVRIALGPDERHPALLARDLTSLDLACGGRSLLCFVPPFTEGLAEAAALCRALWGPGEVEHDGPRFPVQAAAARARPAEEGSPLIAFELGPDEELPAALAGVADMVVRRGRDALDGCRLERL